MTNGRPASARAALATTFGVARRAPCAGLAYLAYLAGGLRALAVLAALCALGALGALALPPSGLAAQERMAHLPPEVARAVVDFFNAPGTLRFHGRSGVPAGGRLVGDVAVLGGPFLLGGHVEGDVVVLNGDLRLEEGSRITGDVTVVGGDVTGLEGALVGGRTVVFGDAIRVVQREGEIRLRSPAEADDLPGLRWGHSRLTVRTAGAYNRVEGLSALFGPRVDLGGEDPLRLEALALWRTEAGFSLDEEEVGYLLRAEQRLGQETRVTLGGTVHSMVSPLGEWGISELESSLSTFLFHRDFRDHMKRTGWGVYARLEPPGLPLTLGLEYRDEDHRFAPVSSPWALRRNQEPWRPEPLVAEGDIRTVLAEAVLDARNDPDHPTDGWWLQGRLTRGVSGDLTRPAVESTAGGAGLPAAPVEAGFTAGFLDLRRYARVTPDADLSFRVAAGGSLDGDPVPSQYQHALGGEGTLPGYRLFAVDCGARSEVYTLDRRAFDEDAGATQSAFGGYGCDRAVLFQAEYRGRLSIDLDLGPDEADDWDDAWEWYPAVDFTPYWAVFFDAGRGWSRTDPGLDTETFADVGIGLLLGDLGLYWAYPLRGDDRGVNFFVRLQRRF